VTPFWLTLAFQNTDAYLLFYKRRTCRPLGGKTHSKIEAARLYSEPSSVTETPVPVHVNEQLPTPPDEPLTMITVSSSRKKEPSQASHNWPSSGRWPTPQSESSSMSTSPPPLDEADTELPSFSESHFDDALQDSLDPLVLSSNRFDIRAPSPTSSNEVEIDSDDEPNAHAIESDSSRASPREMPKETQDGTDAWNTT
jgi:ubiquitin carboxyl-terminal hydrolase 4/11